jgi:hypothetical protein
VLLLDEPSVGPALAMVEAMPGAVRGMAVSGIAV